MAWLGALFGIVYGLLSGLVLASLLFATVVVPALLQPILTVAQLVASLLPSLPAGLLFLLWYGANILIFWLLTIPAQASLVFPATGNLVAETGWQLFLRGFGFGTAATVNLAILVPLFPVSVVFPVLAVVSLAPLLGLVTPIRHSFAYQGVIGWMTWVLPVYWLGNAIGAAMFVFWAAPVGIFTFGLGAIRFDVTSGTVETRVPMGTSTAFNVGTFTFLNGSNPTIVPGNFLGANVSSHEVGHNMNSGAMTPFWSSGTVIEEFRVFGAASVRALGQITAESRGLPRAARFYAPIWSP
jgi:hypothetical protein